MKLLKVATCAVAFFAALTGTASAEYLPDQDVTVEVDVLPDLLPTSSATGSLTFSLQEAVHDVITEVTGVSVDHSYVWVNVNGNSVLAVDPMAFYSLR